MHFPLYYVKNWIKSIKNGTLSRQWSAISRVMVASVIFVFSINVPIYSSARSVRFVSGARGTDSGYIHITTP